MTDIPDDEQKILAEMPLHAITAVYGEQGLRARLAIETGRLDDAAGRQKISEALELAGRLHAADRRQREPYINHLLRVALRIICHYGVRDTDIICAALLHDAVEDHASDLAATGGRPGALGVLAARFGPQAAALVEAVTNPVYCPVRTQTSSTARTSLQASPPVPARGSSRSPTSPITASGSSTPPATRPSGSPPSTRRSSPCWPT